MSPARLLAATFCRELAPDDAGARGADGDDGLEATLRDACARGRAAYPTLALDDQQFVRHLARAGGGADPAVLASLAFEDLFLACACAAGAAGAAEAFRARCSRTIRGAIAGIAREIEIDEIEQQLVKDLLLGTETRPAKIAGYAGRAPLERWVGVAAQRAALLAIRDDKTEARARSAAAAEPALGGHTPPETAFLKDRYRGEFERALVEALGRLPERERLLLRLHLVNGVSVEKIGKMFSVSQPTASRWLAAARETLREDMTKNLAERLGSSSGELASLAGIVASQLDISISVVLKAR